MFVAFAERCNRLPGVVLAALIAAIGPAALAQQCTGGDRGPTMTITGNPAPPCDVAGEVDVYDANDNMIVLYPGDNVAVTVSSEAKGQGTHNRGTAVYDNTVVEISLWNVIDFSTPPQIGWKPSTDPADEAPFLVNRVVDDAGSPIYSPTYTDPNGNHRTWIFKWSSGFFTPVWKTSRMWTLHFWCPPLTGFFYYSGESQDDWNGGGFSFWSSVLGPYHEVWPPGF